MKRIIVIALILITAKATNAQNTKALADSMSTYELEDLIVSATRIERQLSTLPLSAQVITKKEIEQSNNVRLNDLLNEATGLITVADFGGGQGIQMQGLDAEHILIMIDGVPLIGRQAGTLDLTRLTVGNIKQIEIVKGASSCLYGTEALGGVVNLITEKPKTGLNGGGSYRYSSYNTHDGQLDINFKKKKLGLTAFVNRYSSQGYDLDNTTESPTVQPFYNYTFNAKAVYNLTDKSNLLLSGRYFLQNQDYQSGEDLQGESMIDEWNTRLRYSTEFNESWQAQLDIYHTQYLAEEYLIDKTGTKVSRNKFDQTLTMPELRITHFLTQKHSMIGGLGWRKEALDRDMLSGTPTFDSQYGYLQYDGHPIDQLNVIAGFRFDHHSEYTSQWSPKLALRYQLSDDLSIKGSVGYGFKAPDFRQLYFDFDNSAVGYAVLGYNVASDRIPEWLANEVITDEQLRVPLDQLSGELNPESSVNYNIGAQYDPKPNLAFELNLFRNDISNLIDTRVILQHNLNYFSYYNISRAYTQGLELNTNWSPTKYLKISAGYQLLYAKDKDAEEAFSNGEIFARDSETLRTFQLSKDDYFGAFNRSRHMVNVKVSYEIPSLGLETNTRIAYRSKYGLFDTNDNTYLDKHDDFVSGYAIVDWSMNKTFQSNYQLSIGIDNLTGFTDPENITNIPGRVFYLRGKINLEKK